MKKLFICKYCGEVLLGDADKCFYCHKDQRTFFVRYKEYFVVATFILVVVLFLFGLGKF